MNKILVICGPTATGKTSLGIKLARKFNGEIVSADSRQVYVGMDIVTGKDVPSNLKPQISAIKWRDRKLKYYEINGTKIWGYDIVNPDEDFNISFWKECTDLLITDIHNRNKLPIIVGGTGLYIKSLTRDLSQISVSPNFQLRALLSDKPWDYLFNYLNMIDSKKAASLNQSDRHNPRRLIRAIEISISKDLSPPSPEIKRWVGPACRQAGGEILQIGLTAPLDTLKKRAGQKISSRIKNGAFTEAEKLLKLYSPNLSSLTACGYKGFGKPDWETLWCNSEHQYLKRQLVWFKKQPNISWFDITDPNWLNSIMDVVISWYNKNE
jgi:tRNA dimethylallyltransferase